MIFTFKLVGIFIHPRDWLNSCIRLGCTDCFKPCTPYIRYDVKDFTFWVRFSPLFIETLDQRFTDNSCDRCEKSSNPD